MVGIQKSINTSHFQMVYGTDTIFPVQLAIPVAKFLQYHEVEPNDTTRRIYQIIEVHQKKENKYYFVRKYQQVVKKGFDRGPKKEYFQIGDLVLRWDVRRAEKGKHGKFDPLWFGPFKIMEQGDNNTFKLENLQGDLLDAPVNGQFLKPYFQF